MERDEIKKTSDVGTSDDIDSRGAVNALILDYYKKFGRKRDLEQYFSLSTAQSDIKDTSGLFWRKMKSENDSSDSGGRKSDSSHEVCRISIRCTQPDPSSSQEDDPITKTDSPQTESPPIIIEEVPADVSRHTDDDSINFDDNNSQKSLDALLDLSAHKPLSPTSSITSQRKLEWDSLADVGYANESDRKTSASSLSTLERLALKQQYSNNDTKEDIGPPTSHSTPLDENDSKSKAKKGIGKKTTKIYKKDVDFVEVNVPHTSDTNQAPSINVNLTKHISFNVERDGGVTVDNVKKDITISPEKVPLENEPAPSLGMDKEIQTSLTKDKSCSMNPKVVNPYNQKIPVMISLNTLRKRLRRKKSRNVRRKLRTKKQMETNKEVAPLEKSGEQVSEAESFEYMPGHMYNQNQMNDNEPRPDNSTAGNKSSLESSGPLTTDSSKTSKHSLTKDLEKCVDLLKVTLQERYDDSKTKKKLIKDIVHRLITSKYRDDDTTTEFLSGLSYNTKKIGVKGNNTTTSTSDANNTEDSSHKKPKKSILRNDKFNPNAVASTSQSAPNLFSGSSEKVNTNLMKTMNSNTDSDVSSRGKTSSENAKFPKTSSEELYLKYLEALKREEAYKRHLKDKEMFLKQKLVSSETAFKVPIRPESKISSRLKDLMKDLTRNNYDDGSGDASKLEGGSSSNMNFERFNAIRNQRSHSVFTLSSSHSECQKRPNMKKKMQAEREVDEAGPSRHHYCCCPHHYLNSKVGYTDSSVQVNIKPCEDATNEKPCQTKPKACAIAAMENRKKAESPRSARVVPDKTGEIKYVCLCNGKQVSRSDVGDNFMIYKCSKLTNRGVQLEDPANFYNTGVQCGSEEEKVIDDKIELIQSPCRMNTESSSSDNTSNVRRHSKSSQTNMVVNMCLGLNRFCPSSSGSEVKNLCGTSTKCIMGLDSPKKVLTVHEATRCLQTEISINPQIADPTLSDINIISDCDCAKLISEIRKNVSIHRSDSAKTFNDMCTNSTSEKLIPSEGSLYRDEVKSSKTKEDKQSPRQRSGAGKDYVLPIQGTNMTLTVNLGELKTDAVKKTEYVSQGIVTEKISNVDEAISVNEVSRSAQCSCECCTDRSNNRTACIKEAAVSTRRSMHANKNVVNNSVTEVTTNFNTYPKTEAVKEKPSFRRSNTDTGKLAICSCVQTDVILTKDAESDNNHPDASKYASATEVLTAESGCQAGPSNESVLIKVSEQSEDPTPNNVKVPNTKTDKIEDPIKTDSKNIGIQNDFTREGTEVIVVNSKNIEVEKSVVSTKNVGVETEAEKKAEGSCIACQTDIPTIEKPAAEIKEDLPEKNNNIPKLQETCCYKVCCPTNTVKGPVIGMIQDITRRYTKNDVVKIKKKKCFSEIMTVLNYLLETEDSTDQEPKTCCSTSTNTKSSSEKSKRIKMSDGDCGSDRLVDKSVQLSCKKTCKNNQVGTESSDLPCSSDLPATSSDSAACRVLNKIKKECEKYHQKVKCKGRKCEVSSSTSVNCEKCKKVHHCACRSHKCKRSKTFEKLQKKCIAYNLIIQTSESMLSEETVCEKKGRPLKNIIVKVPKRKCHGKNECAYKTEHVSPCSSPKRSPRGGCNRSKSCPNESETSEEYSRRVELATVREYLEQNRPDFVQNTEQRQHCLKFVSARRTQDRYAPRLKMVVVHKPRCMGNVASAPVYCGGVCYKNCDSVEPCIPYEKEPCVPCSPCDADPCISCNSCKPCDQNPCNTGFDHCNGCIDPCNMRSVNKFADERATKRDLLSLHLEQQADLTNLTSDELRQLAQKIGIDLRKKKPAPKFISEREMKKHSEKIYKTLPEVVQKKEEKKKENIKKTNLLMANMFKKNLQKQALRGSVNLSNYSTVIKI